LRGTIDEWDPVFDAISADRRVYIFNNASVGPSSGSVPDTIPGMRSIAFGFIDALGLEKPHDLLR
jgi:hypothetical protein